MEKHNNGRINWNVQGKLGELIQEYLNKSPLHLKTYTPPCAHPGGNVRLPTEVTSGANNLTQPAKALETARTNLLMFDIGDGKELTDQVLLPPVDLQVSNVSVNVNTRKRVHVEDEEEI
ncbi:hypothetical protein ACKAV7_008707 [Fusarium commune]